MVASHFVLWLKLASLGDKTNHTTAMTLSDLREIPYESGVFRQNTANIRF